MKTLTIFYDNQTYEVEVNPTGNVLSIWHIPPSGRPEFCLYNTLDEDVQDQIDHAILKHYGTNY